MIFFICVNASRKHKHYNCNVTNDEGIQLVHFTSSSKVHYDGTEGTRANFSDSNMRCIWDNHNLGNYDRSNDNDIPLTIDTHVLRLDKNGKLDTQDKILFLADK